MRCNICDKQLTEKEISWNKDIKTFEPCSTCLDIALDAAYSDGFRPSEDQCEDQVLEPEEDTLQSVPPWLEDLTGHIVHDQFAGDEE